MNPNLFIIGAPKSGTTTLADLLRQHPDVVVSTPKETCFHFLEYEKGQEYYERTFFPNCGSQKIACDASILNMFYCKVTAERLHSDFPNARLLALLRNPIERAYSDYWESVRVGLETKSFEKTLDVEQKRKDTDTHRIMQYQYFSRGLYADQLEKFLRFYDRQQIMVLTYERFFADPSNELRKIFHFLGIDEAVYIDIAVRKNVGERSVLSPVAQRLFRGDHLLGGLVKFVFRGRSRRLLSAMARKLKQANTKPLEKVPMDSRFRERLVEYYSDSNRRLGRMFDLDLSPWEKA